KRCHFIEVLYQRRVVPVRGRIEQCGGGRGDADRRSRAGHCPVRALRHGRSPGGSPPPARLLRRLECSGFGPACGAGEWWRGSNWMLGVGCWVLFFYPSPNPPTPINTNLLLRVFALPTLLFISPAGTAVAQEKPPRPAPDFADVKYGDHERNVFDLW